jgi:hypothetical protein
VKRLLLPEYARERPADRRPERAVAAAEAFLARRTDHARAHAAATAKACTAARRDTLGYQHRLAEAARALATAVTRTSDAAIRDELFAALAHAEDHLRYRHHVAGDYGKDGEVRAQIAEVVRAALSRC